MTFKIKNKEFNYQLTGILVYFIINIAGLSILLLYYPRYLLFNEKSKEEKIKLKLYKDFAKNIYGNINTPLIKNLTLTKDNENCPENFEQLKAKNQYYGNFTKFYGNKSICIERFNDDEYKYINLLKVTDYDDKRKCGKLLKYSNDFLYVSKKMRCPLNEIEIITKSRAKYFGNIYYQMSPGDHYLTPIYGNNPYNQAIINIEFINNYKVCLEKYSYSRDLSCEFPDNNECFIKDNYEQIYNLEQSDDDYNLNIKNLIKWNFPNIQNVTNFCNPDLKIHIFATGYVNFTHYNYKRFAEEFPSNDLTNNPLYKAYKEYKSPKNIDRFLFLISLIIFLWSLIHFIFQVMLYLEIKGIRKIYMINGIVLFIFKLLSYFGMIINDFYFLNKIHKVYLIMVDKPRNKIIEYYKYSREFLIVKIVFICLIGFLIICIEYIIFLLNYIFDLEDKNLYKISIVSDSPPAILENPYKQKKQTKEIEIPISKNELRSRGRNIIGRDTYSDFLYSNEITLKFIFKNDINKSYLIKVEKDKSFNEALTKLKSDYSELKEKNMKIFITCDSIVINKNKTIKDNQISSYNNTIYIQ